MGCASSVPDDIRPTDSSSSASALAARSAPGAFVAPPPRVTSLRELLVHEHLGESPWEGAFTKVRALGTGASGDVFLVRSARTREMFAMKVLRHLDRARQAEFHNEISLLRTLDHPNIVKLYEYFEAHEDGAVFLIEEALDGGELLDSLNDRAEGKFSDAEAAALVEQMCHAVAYLHAEGVVHRDLKLENWIFADALARKRIKLIDLGLSHRYAAGDEGGESVVGTSYYIAPEIYANKHYAAHADKVDAWSLGVIAYMLLTGSPPFTGRDVLRQARREAFAPSGLKWARLSPDARDFVSRLLDSSAKSRLSVRDALSHPWLAEARNAIEGAPLPPSVLNRLRRFSQLRGWERAVLKAVAFTASDSSGVCGSGGSTLAELRAAFQKFDVGGAGHVTPDDFVAVLANCGVERSEGAALLRACFPHVEGRVSIAYTDFLAATLPHEELTRRALSSAFSALDTGGTGRLTREGMARVVGSEFDDAHLDDLFGHVGGVERVIDCDALHDVFMARVVGGRGGEGGLSSALQVPESGSLFRAIAAGGRLSSTSRSSE